jgi:hypothetical protein
VRAELFHADGRTDMTKLIVVFPILRTRLKMFVSYCINKNRTCYMRIIDDKCPAISSANIRAIKLSEIYLNKYSNQMYKILKS